MSQLISVTVPDIGDFHDVPVIEVLVKAGDSIKVEDPLLTLESDKAALEVPSPAAGVVREVKLKVGDRVSRGTPVLLLEAAEAAEAATPAAAPSAVPSASPVPVSAPAPVAAPIPAQAPQAEQASADLECDLLVLGAGPGGYSAAFRAADLGLSTLLVERYAALGGVCLNVGCIPSKALLHVAAVMEEAAHFSKLGVTFAAPEVDLDKLRAHKNAVVARLTGGLAAMAKTRKVTVLQGLGRFLDPHHLAVAAEGGKKVVRFKNAIIAAGSRPVRLPFVPEDPRIIDSTGALELAGVPEHLLVIGGGIIGLEMATVYSALGAKISVVEMQDGLMPGADRDLVKVFEKKNAKRFERVMLETRVTAVEVVAAGLKVSFAGKQAPPGAQVYDRILVAVGRTPNGAGLDADRAGVAVDGRGFIPVDRQMRTNVPHIFAIGDLVGQPMLAHKAVHEGHVAAEAAAGMKSFFDAAVIPSVAYTDPEIAWVGVTEDQAKARNLAYERGLFPWAASGRAIANGADDGFTKLLFDQASGRIIGGAIVGQNAGDLIGEVALAIEMGADSVDIGKTIHPHPTLGESIGLAAEAAHGTCTDLPPKRKK
ncbi:MAG TPA: dihydrolipoyl dehydrogenase [Rhodocyclaceae bacterium]|nr:dihydrolipoyl dehydrogenase [Rhodocyclaceae bacterium]